MADLLICSGKLRGKKLVLPGGDVLVGRDEQCHIRISSNEVSRQHCLLRCTADGILVRDLASQNGTFINETPITAETLLRPGDRLRIGPLEFQARAKKEPKIARPGEGPETPPDASDDNIAAWLNEESEGAASSAGDTTIIRNQPAAPPAVAVSPTAAVSEPQPNAPPAPRPDPDRKKFRSVAEEAADIIRRHREMVGQSEPQR